MSLPQPRTPGLAAPPAVAGGPHGETIVVETRFGPVTTSRNAIIEMPQGPLGFAQHRSFALTDLPNPRLDQFKLLQSLSDAAVSFVVAPSGRDGGPIAAADIDEACAAAGMASADPLVLLIVTVRSGEAGIAMSVNLRAPVIVDPQCRVGRQMVLNNPGYSVRHPI